MGVRETLNKRPGVAAASGALLLAVAIVVIVLNNRAVPGRVMRAYFSNDGGKSFFVGDIDQIVPFDRDGKPAYRAYVYRCGGDDPFVAYLARHTEGARNRIANLGAKATDPEAASEIAQLRSNSIEVRKPGQMKWVPLHSAEGETLVAHPKCPDGSTATAIYP